MLSIENLKASLQAFPLLDLSKYMVMITGPNGTLNQQLTTRCSSATLPGRSIATTERFHHGPIRKIPYSEIYDDVSLTFIASDTLEERAFFNEWQRLIGGQESYNIAWYEDIIGTVSIHTLDKQGAFKTTTVLYEAYPITIDALTFDYTSGDQVPLLNVTFAYHHWELK